MIKISGKDGCFEYQHLEQRPMSRYTEKEQYHIDIINAKLFQKGCQEMSIDEVDFFINHVGQKDLICQLIVCNDCQDSKPKRLLSLLMTKKK
jgi:hypothetical protein